MTVSDASLPARMSRPGKRPAIRLVVNADDFGLAERVNDGILLAHRSGIVTAASLMPVGRAFEHAADGCRRVPTLDVGVHLTLVAETPLLANASTLTGGDGRFPRAVGAFMKRYLQGKIRRADIEAELRAQIERLLDHGLTPTHLDSHQHLHALPGVARIVRQLAARYGIPFVRVPVEEFRIHRPLSLRAVYRRAGALLLRGSWLAARLAGAARAGRRLRFLGFAEGGRLNRARLHRLLLSLQPGRTYELMCHPGFTPREPDIRHWSYHHEQELLALTSASTRAVIAARGIRLCSFKDVAPSLFLPDE